MDSCVLQNECIDEMAAEAGVSQQVAEITKQAMSQGMDFAEALRQRLLLIKGLPANKLRAVWDRLSFNPGAVSLLHCLKANGFKTALLSGGFTYFAHRVAAILQMDYAFANELDIDNGVLSGTVKSPIVDGMMKNTILLRLAQREDLSLQQIVAIGDGANDRWMINSAGLGVAYHGKSILREATKHHLNVNDLRGLAYFMGLSIASLEETTINLKAHYIEQCDIPPFLSLNEFLN